MIIDIKLPTFDEIKAF